MIKKEYAKKIGDKLGLNYNMVSNIIDAFIEELSDEIINNDKTSITNFGTFQKKLISPKNQFSPVDGSKLNVSSYYRLSFTCSNELLTKLKKNKKN